MGVEIGEKLPFSPRPPLRSPEWTARVSKRLCSPMVTYSKALLLRRLVSTLRPAASAFSTLRPWGSACQHASGFALALSFAVRLVPGYV
jgi:hypothetical protein